MPVAFHNTSIFVFIIYFILFMIKFMLLTYGAMVSHNEERKLLVMALITEVSYILTIDICKLSQTFSRPYQYITMGNLNLLFSN